MLLVLVSFLAVLDASLGEVFGILCSGAPMLVVVLFYLALVWVSELYSFFIFWPIACGKRTKILTWIFSMLLLGYHFGILQNVSRQNFQLRLQILFLIIKRNSTSKSLGLFWSCWCLHELSPVRGRSVESFLCSRSLFLWVKRSRKGYNQFFLP